MQSLSYEELKKLAQVYPPLSPAEQEALAVRAANGDREAEELLIRHNAKRLLYFLEVFTPDGPGRRWIAPDDWKMRSVNKWRKFAPKSLKAEDILSAAQYGLLKAIRSYRPMPGSFSNFNRYANIVIFREIQHLRERHEHAVQPPFGPEPEDEELPPLEGPSEEREFARMLFLWYAEKYLAPEEYERLLSILAGEEADPLFLEKIGEKLREKIPPADWAYLAEALTGPAEPVDWIYRE
ncbi:MAG: hypothetical protein NZ651_06570 [Candidatus Bipolaricaulota bacterium]|nr:hypothetical protein [Candidatus Bipolaricaulota bacterium]MDW8127417.1 hypothetical protein [Candidatus Bipolaricaulota bacterium]